VFFFAIIGILMVPFQSVVVPLYLWVSRLGLLDTYLGILARSGQRLRRLLMRQAIEWCLTTTSRPRGSTAGRMGQFSGAWCCRGDAGPGDLGHHQVHVDVERVLLAPLVVNSPS